jgi:predicted glycosyl hydrolase (DUF1957 family)
MPSPSTVPHLKDTDEFFVDAQTNTIMQDVWREREQARGLIDETLLRQAQDWSFLSDKAV